MTSLNSEGISDSVREIDTPDGAVLLDIRERRCLAINPTGADIWRYLKRNRSIEEILASLIESYPDTPPDLIAKDVDQFVAMLKRKRLLVVNDEHSPALRTYLFFRLLHPHFSSGKPSTRLLVLRAFLGLLIFDLFGFRSNFARINKTVRDWPVAPRVFRADTVDQVSNAMNYACVWYPKRVRCLQRSSVTTCLLRSSGVKAVMVIGAQGFPFKAHAWTEVDERAVNERRNVQKIYFVWERC
jgi:hypothetical protein